jgi:hypothetical protein
MSRHWLDDLNNMKRYFYKANPAVRRVLEKQLNLVQQ